MTYVYQTGNGSHNTSTFNMPYGKGYAQGKDVPN